MINPLLLLSKTLLSLVVFLGVFASTSDTLASVVIKIDPDKRIQTSISCDSTNRIAFANDRIAQIFGDEEAYTLQSDETRGQLFLKPTEANGEKPIAVTLITEQGMVQDMEFTPQKISTRTIILKGEGKPSFDKSSHPNRKGENEQCRPAFSPSSLGLPHSHAKTPGGDRSAHFDTGYSRSSLPRYGERKDRYGHTAPSYCPKFNGGRGLGHQSTRCIGFGVYAHQYV